MTRLFREGGPHRIRRSGRDTYSFSIAIPPDEDGLIGRECRGPDCAPAYFKVRPGTGLTNQSEAFCPYCRVADDPGHFMTQGQVEYGKRIVEREAAAGFQRAMRDALRLGPSGRRQLGGGFLSIDVSLKPSRLPHVGRPIEEELRRDVTCPHCGLEHAVFGLATWCADCGRDIFNTHLAAELGVLRKMLAVVDERRATLGPRVAARDVENGLEDLVSVAEAVLKALARRHLLSSGRARDEVEEVFERRVRNGFQNLARAKDLFAAMTGAVIGRALEQHEFGAVCEVLEKRHPIAHNLGVVDRKYLARARAGELAGREVGVTAAEVVRAIDSVELVLVDAWTQLFGTPPADEPS
jgi:hypothetical protein